MAVANIECIESANIAINWGLPSKRNSSAEILTKIDKIIPDYTQPFIANRAGVDVASLKINCESFDAPMNPKTTRRRIARFHEGIAQLKMRHQMAYGEFYYLEPTYEAGFSLISSIINRLSEKQRIVNGSTQPDRQRIVRSCI